MSDQEYLDEFNEGLSAEKKQIDPKEWLDENIEGKSLHDISDEDFDRLVRMARKGLEYKKFKEMFYEIDMSLHDYVEKKWRSRE